MAGRRGRMRAGKVSDSAFFGDLARKGIDTTVFRNLIGQILPNPRTGRVELADVQRYMMENMHTPEVMAILQEGAKGWLDEEAEALEIDLATFDYSSLPVVPEGEAHGIWVVKVERAHDILMPNSSRPRAAPAPQTKTMISILVEDHPRHVASTATNPTAQDILQAIQRAMVKPMAQYEPALPWNILIPLELQHHMPVLRPFFASLPPPFSYKVEDAALRERRDFAAEVQRHAEYKASMKSAHVHKDAANWAYGRKERRGALQQYRAAIAAVEVALANTNHAEEGRDAARLRAILYANRSAAYLLEGEGWNAQLALADAETAETADRTYVKAYVRLARAHEALNDGKKAKEALQRGLRVPQLSGESALTQLLAELDKKA